MQCSVCLPWGQTLSLSALVGWWTGEKGEGCSYTDVQGWPWLTPGAHQAPPSLPSSAAGDVQSLPGKQGLACRAVASEANSWHQCQALPTAGKLLGSSPCRLRWGGCSGALGTLLSLLVLPVLSQSCLWGRASVLPCSPLGAGHTGAVSPGTNYKVFPFGKGPCSPLARSSSHLLEKFTSEAAEKAFPWGISECVCALWFMADFIYTNNTGG